MTEDLKERLKEFAIESVVAGVAIGAILFLATAVGALVFAGIGKDNVPIAAATVMGVKVSAVLFIVGVVVNLGIKGVEKADGKLEKWR